MARHQSGSRTGRRLRPVLLIAAPLLLPGCIVHAAYDVATAPVRATAWTADKLTTSQKEADRNRGRREREAEERQARADRKAARQQRKAQEAAARQAPD